MRKMFITFLLMSGGMVACTAEETVDSTDVTEQNTVGEVQKTVTQNYDFVITPKNVTGDFRTFFQNVVNKYSNVLIKNGTYEIDVVGGSIRPQDGCTITFESKAKIKVKPNKLDAYQVFNLRGRKDITFWNPTLEGDKYTHLSKTGEWGHGINIMDCSNITIHSASISKFWGDAIYVNNCENIKIYDANLSDNRRQGISIISGKNIEIHRPIIEKTGGTSPGYGIDVEPNFNGESTVGLRIYKPVFKGNGINGGAYPVGFCLSTKGAEILNPAIGKFVDSNIDIEIFEPTFEGDMVYITAPSDRVKGFIKIHNPVFNNSEGAALYLRNLQSSFFQTEINNPKIQNTKSSTYLAPIVIHCGTEGVKTTGTTNVEIKNPTIENNKVINPNNSVGIRNLSTNKFKNDLKNVIISNVLIKGYERPFFNHGGSINNLSDLSPLFVLNFNNKSEFPQLLSKTIVAKTFHGMTINYTAEEISPTVYVGDDIPVTDAEFYYKNNAKNKAPLKLLFGISSSPSKMYIGRWGTERFSGIEIPYGGFVKFKKNKTNHLLVVEASSTVTAIK